MTQAVGGGDIPSGFYRDGAEMVDVTGATYKLVAGAWVMIRDAQGHPVPMEPPKP